jgi:hypothetical protein
VATTSLASLRSESEGSDYLVFKWRYIVMWLLGFPWGAQIQV